MTILQRRKKFSPLIFFNFFFLLFYCFNLKEEKRPFDFELFAQLLEKVLADEEKRRQKSVKSQKPKEKKPLRPKKKTKGISKECMRAQANG